ncbi:MAG: potassium-transporting ATPase subunit KdpA [Gemmatimonadetes bacterium]|nr:potassium-transporting ATPase subunit KdpA [Gemmatimonadota bacterium]
MTSHAALELFAVLALVLGCAVPLGAYIARVLEPGTRRQPLAIIERAVYRVLGVDPAEDMPWTRYATGVVALSAVGVVVLYALQRVQGVLPLNDAVLPAVPPLLAFNTAVSFVTNTNWQAYGGETTLSLLTQMIGLTVQNFVSAAVGLAVLAALVRGFTRRQAKGVGNLWVDLTRGMLYVLLPLALLVAVVLAADGVPQTLDATRTVSLLAPAADSAAPRDQRLPLGAVASQVAIKQLGTNGGGVYNVNSAHPFENPTPLTNLVEVVSILLIPAALCITFGALVGDRRQGWAILAAMTVLLVATTLPTIASEQAGTPALASAGASLSADATQAGGNMEGKEVRFGIVSSAIWATATTAASNGSVNAMHDSFTPLGGLLPMWLMQLGEVVFGGVGSGLYGMLVFAVLAVFLAGLMVGRTPEYLGKKLEAREIKLAALVVLVPSAFVLVGTAASLLTAGGRAGIFNPGAHGFSEVLYALSSAANNNGSAFGGLGANSAWYNALTAVAMWIGRFWIIVPVLALAGALAQKQAVPPGPGTLPTTGPIFVVLLVGTVVLVGALTFLPALALGPIVEHLQLMGGGR